MKNERRLNIMIIKNYLIGAKYLDFKTKTGDEVKGTQVFLINAELINSDDGRIPEKVFFKEKNMMSKLVKAINSCDRDILIPVECDVTLSGNKIVYNDIKVVDSFN